MHVHNYGDFLQFMICPYNGELTFAEEISESHKHACVITVSLCHV